MRLRCPARFVLAAALAAFCTTARSQDASRTSPFQQPPLETAALESSVSAPLAARKVPSAQPEHPFAPTADGAILVARQEESSDESAPSSSASAAPRFDPALVSAGRAAFETSCTQCHDADRSLSKRKDLPGWRATVRRMAGKSGADVPQGDWEAIATYLASLARISHLPP